MSPIPRGVVCAEGVITPIATQEDIMRTTLMAAAVTAVMAVAAPVASAATVNVGADGAIVVTGSR